MRPLFQQTLKNSISCTGIGLHSGRKIQLTLRPAPVDSGITFIRTDMSSGNVIHASADNVAYTQLATTLSENGATVATVEHLMAAFSGLGIDNARVEVFGPEVPIMDGSAAPFVYLLKSVGLKQQPKPVRFAIITRPVVLEDDDRSIAVTPDKEFSVDYTIDFEHPLIRYQNLNLRLAENHFENELSRARTFGFLHEVDYLKKNGLALGASLSNAVVLDRFRIVNDDGLRYPDEFVRHKLLDFIGDISLMGAPIIGKFTVIKSGHSLNQAFLRSLKKRPDAWKLVEFCQRPNNEIESMPVPAKGLLEPEPIHVPV